MHDSTSRQQSRRDAALAAGLCGASLVQVLAWPIASPAVSVLVAVGSTAPLAWRHRAPAAAALAGSVVWLVPTDGFLALGFLVAALLYFCVGSEIRSLRAAVAVTALGTLLAVVATLRGPEPPPAALGAALAVLGPAAAGRLLAHQRRQTALLRDLAEQLVTQRTRAERAAVAEERSRIARELHDVLGHDVTVIALQADAASAALARSPELAAAPVAAIRQAATDALREMRSVLGVLRSGDGTDPRGATRQHPEDDDVLRPQPTLLDLPALVQRCRDTGVDVAVDLALPERPMPASVQLAAYRVVQEALTNARRHAEGASVRVQVCSQGDDLVVEVHDTGGRPTAVAGGGTGLVGLRERVRLLGGRLEASPSPGGGFGVTARFPLEPWGAA